MAVDTSIYERQRRGVEDQYAATSASNAYSRFLSQKRGDRSMGDARRGFKREQPGFQASFGQRGLSGGGVQSGVMQNAMSQRLGDFQRGMGRMQEDQQDSMRQFDLGQAQMDQWRTGALQDIEAEKERAIAHAALNLNALRPYMGGY